FLGQLIYDVHDDLAGAASGLRGHSLLRTMYGYNYNAIATGTTSANIVIIVNSAPFSGVGRLHYTQTTPKFTEDDYKLVNYTWFQADGFVRDPERVGTRTEAQLRAKTLPNPYPYVGGNAPYTYPDLNSFFLAAVKADGTVLTPSFHRKWLFNPNNDFNDMS